MSSLVESLRESFRIADAADILLVAVFLYALLLWFKSTTSRPILVGVGVLAVVFVLARAFALYMTTAIFQASLAVAAVAAVVVFQEDLRRTFARLALLGKLPRARTARTDSDLAVVGDVAFDLARKKVGALIAFRGLEPLDRHLHKGVVTEARISRSLLDSIFDPHSLGHDGAVVIDRDRIAQFAAHLPLSQNATAIGNRGTRHSAALGLSEVSDALVIVVSEERGEVSMASHGVLTRMASPAELARRLDEFTHRVRPATTHPLGRRILVENPGLKVIALVAACVAWGVTSFETESVQKTFVVPVEYRNLPDTLDIDDSAPTEARITLTGLERAFTLLAPSALKVSLDLSKVVEGEQQFVIDDSYIKLPAKLTLFRSSPRTITFGVHTWVRARVSVDVQTRGRLRRDLRDREIRVTPDTVPVSIWRSVKSPTVTLSTEPVDLGKLTEGSEIKVKLVVPQFMRIEGEQFTEVRVGLEAAPSNAPANVEEH